VNIFLHLWGVQQDSQKLQEKLGSQHKVTNPSQSERSRYRAILVGKRVREKRAQKEVPGAPCLLTDEVKATETCGGRNRRANRLGERETGIKSGQGRWLTGVLSPKPWKRAGGNEMARARTPEKTAFTVICCRKNPAKKPQQNSQKGCAQELKQCKQRNHQGRKKDGSEKKRT